MKIIVSICPVCKGVNFDKVFSAKDHTVSQEVFDVMECRDCKHRFTSPIPDAQSIGPYYKSDAYISHTNTSKGLINRAYQIVRKFTLGSKRKLITKETGLSKGSLLDIGSGAGAFLAEMKSRGWEVKGLEPDPDARAVALRDFGVTAQPLEELDTLAADSYDAITMWHVLEHVHELDACIQKINQAIKKSGRVFIAVPNYTSWDARKYGSTWAAYDVPRHLYHFSPASMKRLVESNGFKLLKMKKMPFDSFYVSMLSERIKGQNVLLGVWNGFRSYLAAMGNPGRCSSVIYVLQK